MSTVFFDQGSDPKTYVYNKKAVFSKTQTYNRSGEGRIVSERKVTLLDTGVKFNINFEYPQCTEEIVYTYSRETDIASSVEVKDSCDELKTSDLVSGYKETLSGLLSLIGSKENLDLIPILGGKESVCGLYYSDGVDSEGEVTKERYYGLEYRVTQGKELQRTTLFEAKLEAAGFTKGTESGIIFKGDTYSKAISVKGEEKTRGLEVGYSVTYSTLAIAISLK